MEGVKKIELKIFANGLQTWVKIGEKLRIAPRILFYVPTERVIYI